VGPGEVGPLLAQGDPDQGRPPGGVLTAQGQCSPADRIGRGVRHLLGRVIIGRDAVGSAVAESFRQMAHGPRGEIEGGREAGGRLALLGAVEQLPPHGNGYGLWHGEGLRDQGSRWQAFFH
jgi:hypothetical protein